MSYDPRLASRPYGSRDEDDANARKGSVRAARERLQAAQMQQQLPDRSRIIGLPQKPNQLVSQFSAQSRLEQQQQNLTPPDSRGNGNAFASPSPQWPLSNNTEDVLDSRPGQYQRSPERGPPPQRPPRPISDDLPIEITSPSDYRDSYQSDEMFSPASVTMSSRPLTTSSAASESSSLGSIPDFPVPQVPLPTIQPLPRRQASLGPPPSARRGPSSYYTQMSYVSPIAEESEARSDILRSHHGSFASSNVIPSNAEDFYLEDDGILSDDDETLTSDYGRDSRGSDHDEQSELVQQPALVRQASLGRRTKPSLMTIKSVDGLGDKKGGPVKRKPIADGVDASASAAGIGSAMLAAREGISAQAAPGTSRASLSLGTDPFDASSSESLDSLRNIKSRFGDADPEKEELGSSIQPVQQGTRQMTLAERVGKRRPPRIDVDAVRDAEARGSLTSLPELIRRATRLAANLDRGKTASRLGLDMWESGAPERSKLDSRRSGSLSDMLAAFPPPGEATPTGDRTPNPNRMSKWPSNAGREYAGAASASPDQKPTTRRRRCCGMPMWTFVTLLIVLLFLIAAAVIIPIVLIVIPKIKNTQNAAQSNSGESNTNNNTPPAAAPTASGSTSQCNGIITCQNGGVAIMNSDRSCNCVCINGFTGKTCSTQTDAGCTTTNIAGTANNATVGSGIPRLLSSAQNNFSMPLDPSSLLSLFSNLGLSCTGENALVTFNGLASRSIPPAHLPLLIETTIEPSRSLPLPDLPHPERAGHKFEQRQAIGGPGTANQKSKQNAVAAATATTEAASTPTPTQPISSNATAIDFARVGVLLALQETRTLDTAATAQEALQSFLTNDRNGDGNGNTVNMGPFQIDLVKFSIKFQNGTTIQARPSSTTKTTAT